MFNFKLKNSKSVLNLIVLLCLVKTCISASLSLSEQKKYKQLIEGQGLYTKDDDIEIYTNNNFKNIYEQPRGILIEFYNSWCGFCQRFAPSWKALGTDVKHWIDIVQIGAIDCSDEDNSPICREFEIMGYPTIRYFHEFYESGPKKIGADVPKGEDMDKLRQNLVARLILEQKEGRGRTWPVLLPYNGSNIDTIFGTLPQRVRYAFAIIEDKTVIGPEVALDLHKMQNITVVPVSKNNTRFTHQMHITTFPALLVISRDDQSTQHLPTLSNNREGYLQTIKNFLKNKGLAIPTEPPKDKFRGKWIENDVPDMAALLEARERQALLKKVKQMGDVVFQMDLETALRSALKHEVATTKVINGEKLQALRNFLSVVIKYFPLGRKGKEYIEGLFEKTSGNLITGAEIADYLKVSDNVDSDVFSSPQQWLACSGSSPKYRGFPCGMWKMFHYLTVNAADQNHGNQAANPREVLQAMHGYIKNFFGCADCSKHFQEMAARNDLNGVSDVNSSVIWLWIAHNEVNKRLSGDQTEDPEHPKIQFPSHASCPKCRENDKWNLHEVFQFLNKMYSAINVRYLGSDTKVLHDGFGAPRQKRSSGAWQIINRMDVSMCFILYVVCFGLLVLIVRQFLKKGYKKKMYVHDLLGKV